MNSTLKGGLIFVFLECILRIDLLDYLLEIYLPKPTRPLPKWQRKDYAGNLDPIVRIVSYTLTPHVSRAGKRRQLPDGLCVRHHETHYVRRLREHAQTITTLLRELSFHFNY